MKKNDYTADNQEQLKQFRAKAESILNSKKRPPDTELSGMEARELLHELQVFQIELEMQNDELRSSHESLEQERKKFSGLYDLAPVGYFILDQFGIINEVNAIGIEMLSAQKSWLIKQRLQHFITDECTKDFYAFIHKLTGTRQRKSCQLSFKIANGGYFYARVEGIGIRNAEGDLNFYIAVIDITESSEAEQRLLESNERIKMILEVSGTGTWEIDLEKKVIVFDDYCYTIYGYQPWEFDGTYESFFKSIHPEDLASVREAFELAVKQANELDLEFRSVINGAVKYLKVRGHVVRKKGEEGDKARHVAGILIDITESKKLQLEAESLRLNQQKKIHAATLEGQENERKRISESLHDSVSQLLYAIRLNFQNYKEVPTGKESFASINQLIDQAIKETRNISFELAPSVLTDFGLREGIKEMLSRISTPGFVIKSRLNGLAERLDTRLEMSVFRIVQELLNNSIKNGHATQSQVKINRVNQQINIVVTDNGVGFNTKNTDYLLKGSGLRSIATRVSLFNGNMDLKSAPTQGTTVSIRLFSNNEL